MSRALLVLVIVLALVLVVTVVIPQYREARTLSEQARAWRAAEDEVMERKLQADKEAREARLRAKAILRQSPLRLLMGSLKMYAAMEGEFPPNFETLLHSPYLRSPDGLIAPDSDDEVRPDYPRVPARASLDELKLGPENCSYVLVVGVRVVDPPDTIVIYEKKPFARGGRHVGFRNGWVEFMPEERFQKLLAEQKDRMKADGQ